MSVLFTTSERYIPTAITNVQVNYKSKPMTDLTVNNNYSIYQYINYFTKSLPEIVHFQPGSATPESQVIEKILLLQLILGLLLRSQNFL